MRVVAILLIVAGVVMLVSRGVTWTKDREVLDVGPLEATVEEKKTIPFTPIGGVVALGAGLVLLLASRRRPA